MIFAPPDINGVPTEKPRRYRIRQHGSCADARTAMLDRKAGAAISMWRCRSRSKTISPISTIPNNPLALSTCQAFPRLQHHIQEHRKQHHNIDRMETPCSAKTDPCAPLPLSIDRAEHGTQSDQDACDACDEHDHCCVIRSQ
ncbi:MAG: hypothetical protein C5S47_02710 [Candidatus Methanogasteraceae archaeon]|nr:MAG: hypothetical protein C5S47_02710 [ANME-2 cluster archaeon]